MFSQHTINIFKTPVFLRIIKLDRGYLGVHQIACKNCRMLMHSKLIGRILDSIKREYNYSTVFARDVWFVCFDIQCRDNILPYRYSFYTGYPVFSSWSRNKIGSFVHILSNICTFDVLKKKFRYLLYGQKCIIKINVEYNAFR